MVNELELPSFSKPVTKEKVVAVYANWENGGSMSFVASNALMSTKKVCEIIIKFPREWKPDVAAYRRNHFFKD